MQKLAEARAKIEAHAKESRYARDLAEHEARLAAREAKVAANGQEAGRRPPQPPTEGPQAERSDQSYRRGGGRASCLWPAAALSSDL